MKDFIEKSSKFLKNKLYFWNKWSDLKLTKKMKILGAGFCKRSIEKNKIKKHLVLYEIFIEFILHNEKFNDK